MLDLFRNIIKIRISRQNQIIFAAFNLCLLIYILSSSLMILKNNVNNLKKENEINLNRIEFIAAIEEQEINSKSAFSSNFASSVNSSARDNKLKIDRTLPISNNEISIWINESNFIDLFNWFLEINNNGVEITKMSIRRISKETVSAQLTVKL
jgi:hypothetical protein